MHFVQFCFNLLVTDLDRTATRDWDTRWVNLDESRTKKKISKHGEYFLMREALLRPLW